MKSVYLYEFKNRIEYNMKKFDLKYPCVSHIEDIDKCKFETIAPAQPVIGCRILRVDGTLYQHEEWDSAWNDEAVGVYICTELKHRFVVAKTDVIEGDKKFFGWGKEQFPINGVPNLISDDISGSKTDLNGKINTEKIIQQTESLDFRYAAQVCKEYNFPGKWNGRGYLGSVGEWAILINKIKAQDREFSYCLAKCGGDPISGPYENCVWWTSTQNGVGGNVALVRDFYFDAWSSRQKTLAHRVRPFVEFEVDF